MQMFSSAIVCVISVTKADSFKWDHISVFILLLALYNNNNNNTIYLQLAEEIAKANKGQLYTTFTIFSKNN